MTLSKLAELITAGAFTKEQIKERLMAKVNKEGRINTGLEKYSHLSQCWISLGTPTTGGYGQICISGIGLQTHRLSCWLANDCPTISSKDYIGHKCDNPTCCNPDHLEIVPPAKNVADAIARGLKKPWAKEKKKCAVACTECNKERHKCVYVGTDPCAWCQATKKVCVREERKSRPGDFKKGTCGGDSNLNAKLTDAQFAELQTKLSAPMKYGDMGKLAVEYGISYGYIQQIKAGKCSRILTTH